jgi:hypothetical protein
VTGVGFLKLVEEVKSQRPEVQIDGGDCGPPQLGVEQPHLELVHHSHQQKLVLPGVIKRRAASNEQNETR